MTRPQVGVIQVTIGAALISFAPVFAKLAHVGPTMAGFYRMLFGGIFLVIILIARRESIWNGSRLFVLSLICGALFAADLAFWHRSINFVGPGLATLLANFQVFFVAAFGVILLGERLGWRLACAIPLAIAGLFLIVGIDIDRAEHGYKIGVLYGLITAVTYATFLLVFRKLRSTSETRSSFPAVAVISLSAAALLTPVAAIQGESFSIPDSTSVLVLVTYGLVGQVLGWVFISWGIRKIESSKVGLILLLQPTLAFVWDILFFARVTTVVEVAGAVLALGAIYLGAVSHAGQRQSGK
jgi:drug/metabolite transporter (DMT)-like permease